MKPWMTSTRAIALVLAALLALLAWLALQARPSTEAVRLRNALLFQVGTPADFDWRPEQRPASFATDTAVPDQPFAEPVRGLALATQPDDWSRALQIANHLIRHARQGGAARSDLAGTYQQILAGSGYCADYTTTFIAMARSAGMFAREWAFSFDGFGGHGHALIEIWDRQHQAWRMLDVFNNWVPLDTASNAPMSVAEFRRRLGVAPETVRVERIGPGRFGFRNEAALWDYYRAGADQWYLWWGNAVYAYDASPATRWLGSLSRAAEQLGAVALGVHPKVMAVPSATNASLRERMQGLKHKLFAAFGLGAVLSLVLFSQLFFRWRRR